MSEIEGKKLIIRNTLMLYIRMAFNVIVALISSRLILNILGVEDYGIYNVVGGVVSAFMFLNTAMASATQRFLTYEMGEKENQEQLQLIFSTSVLIHIVVSICVIFLVESLGLWLLNNKMVIPSERMQAALWVFHCSAVSCVISIITVPYSAAIIAREKMQAYAYISMLEVSLRLFVVCLLYYVSHWDKLQLYALLLLGVSLVILLIYKIYSRRNIPEASFHYIWDRTLFHKMLSFAGWNLFGNLAFVAYTQGLNILLNIFFGPVVNAARGVAVQLQGVIKNFNSSFQTALNPQIVKKYASGDLEGALSLVMGGSKYSFLLLLLLLLPLWIEAEQILVLWLKIVPDYTLSFLRIILLTTLLDVLSYPLITLAQATGNIRNYQLIVGGILLLIVPISYLVLLNGGAPESVFIVHLIFAFVAQFFRLYLLNRMIGISMMLYFRRVVSPLIIVLFMVVWGPLWIYSILDVSLVRLILVVIVSWGAVIGFGYKIGLSHIEKLFVKEQLKKLRKRYL